MSTLSGIAAKGEKGKSKYQCLDINNLYRGESLEPSQQKSTVQRCKYGMQSLGKVPSARRPPANLPSLKSENSGNEPAVSLVPTGGAGWGNKPGETQPPSTQQNVTANSNNAAQTQATPVSSSNSVISTHSTPLPSSHDQTVTTTHSTPSDKSWSIIMAGEAAAHPPSFLAHQSPLFQQEFPKLSSGDAQNVQTGQKSGSDTQYGPGPILRPQTEGSWIQGGGRSQASGLSGTNGSQSLVQGPLPHLPAGVDPAGGRNNLGPPHPTGVGMGPGGHLGIPTNGPTIHGPSMHPPPGTSPQFRGMPPAFMYRGNFSGGFPPSFQPSIPHPRQRFPGGWEGKFVGRPVDGEEIITRPIIKEEELNHMDDIARDSSWARPDEIDYNEKIHFSDSEESIHNEEEQSIRDEKREIKESVESEKDRNRIDRDRTRERDDRDQERDRRSVEERCEKRADSVSRSWQPHSYNRYSSASRPQHPTPRDKESEDEILKEKRRLQVELVALVTERAIKRKEEEEKRHEEIKRAAAKKLQQLDEKLGKGQNNEKKDREDSSTTIVPLPNWADKNRQGDSEREKPRSSCDITEEKQRHEVIDYRSSNQVDRQSFLPPERETRSRMSDKRDFDEKDKLQPSHRQDRTRMEDRDRNIRDGTQNRSRQMPPRFLKQQAERNQSGMGSNSNYMRNTASPQPSNSSSNTFDPHWSHSANTFSGKQAAQTSGSRLISRRFNYDSNESNPDKPTSDRDNDDWSTRDRYRISRERNCGKHSAPVFDSEHGRRFLEKNERRDGETERNCEENWEREVNRDKDAVPREKDRERQAEERSKTEISYDKEREWRRVKDRKSEERETVEYEDERNKDNNRRDERRIERPQRPDSRDSRTSRDSRNSRDSVREEKHETIHKTVSGIRSFNLGESHLKDEKKKNEKKDEREAIEQGHHGKYADEYLFTFPNKPRHRFNYPRHVPGPPITREKLEASERNETKRSLIQLNRFSDEKRVIEEKDIWGNHCSKERKSGEVWPENTVGNDVPKPHNLKQVVEEKGKTGSTEKKEIGKVQTETTKSENSEKITKNETKEEREKPDTIDEDKEKREKAGKNRGGRGRTDSNRGRQGWSISVFKNSHGNRGDRRRRDSGRLSGRYRYSSCDWNQASESDFSVDEVSASTESGKEEKKRDSSRSLKHRSNFKKVEKEERNKEMKKNENVDCKINYQDTNAARLDRKNECVGREGFAPSGQPSRRGRGSLRMRGGVNRRLDGYGPPPAKSPFGRPEDKKVRDKSSENVSDDKINPEEEIKGKQKLQTSSTPQNNAAQKTNQGGIKSSHNNVPPRMQKKPDVDSREVIQNKSNRGNRHSGNKQCADQGDDAWETTSENSDEERKHDSGNNRKNYSRRPPFAHPEAGSRTNRNPPPSGKRFNGRESHGNKTNDSGRGSDRNSSVRSHNASVPKFGGSKDNIKIPDVNSIIEKSKLGCDEKEFDEGRNKMKDVKEISKTERRSGRDRDKERRSKSSKDLGNQQQQTLNNVSGTTTPQPLMSQVVPTPPAVAKNYERKTTLPPRLQAKQRQSHRIQKQQSVDISEANKINHPMTIFPMKDSGTGNSVNAWEKPLRSASPKSTSIQMLSSVSETHQSENPSQRNSPHISRDTIDKALLDGSSPPVNTIIFENTNFKSTPNDIMKNQFSTHLKSQRTEKGERKLSEEPQELLGFSSGKTDIASTTGERDVKSSETSIIYGKTEDTSDMKLDFPFETELSQLTDDKATKGMRDLARSIQQSTMSPSTADLNFKIASVKKVWESMHTVTEHSEDGNNVSTFSPNFSPDSTMDPSTYSKTVDGAVVVTDDGSEVVYNTVPPMQVNVNYTTSKTDVSSTTSNVCKVKPQQQAVLSSGHSPIGHSGQSPLSHAGPISPPPYNSTQASQFNYQQNNIGGAAAQFGGISAIPSPPTVLYNSSTQLPPAFQTFQIDGTQVLSNQAARSQFSQFPPYGLSQGIGQTSAFNQQSVYLHQTAPPTATPDIYQSSLSQYRLQPAAAPFGQSQINNNPNTVLISSTANSLMSATVKPSTQPIGTIGTKGGAPFQQNPLPSQHSQLFIPFDPVQLGVNQNYLPNSQIVQRGAPVQPSAPSFYSSSAGAQAGFYQTSGSTLAQQAPGGPQLHQATGYSLQGFNSQTSATAVGLQSFGSQMGAQQYRTAGNVGPTTYLKSTVTPHHPATLSLAQKTSATSTQQDVLDSVFSSAPQIPSPKPRSSKQLNQQQSQQSPTQQSNSKFGSYQNVTNSSQLQSGVQQRGGQSNINLQNVRSSGSSPRYPNPIQRPIAYQHGNVRPHRPQISRPASNVKPYFGSQDGNIKLEESNELKTDDTSQINCDSKLSETGSQNKTDSAEDDAPKE